MSIPYRLLHNEAVPLLYAMEFFPGMPPQRVVSLGLDLLAALQQDGEDEETDPFSTESMAPQAKQSWLMNLATQLHDNQPRLDALLRGAATHWRLHRIAPIDRAILRLGIYQLEFVTERPWKTVIHEAVQLADRYSTAESPGFINALLDRIRKDLGRNEP